MKYKLKIVILVRLTNAIISDKIILDSDKIKNSCRYAEIFSKETRVRVITKEKKKVNLVINESTYYFVKIKFTLFNNRSSNSDTFKNLIILLSFFFSKKWYIA